MNTEIVSQKERFLREVEQQLLRKELDAKLLEEGLVHVRWKEKPLCSVDRDGIVRFRPEAPAQGAGYKATGGRSDPRQMEWTAALLG